MNETALLSIFSDTDLVSNVLKNRGLSFFDPKKDFESIRADADPPLSDAELNLKTYVLFVGNLAPKVSRVLELSLRFILEEKDQATATLVSMVYRTIILNITTNPQMWSGTDLTPRPLMLRWNKVMAPIISSQQDFEKFVTFVENNY